MEALCLEKKRVSMSPFDKWKGVARRIFSGDHVEGRIP
jgi:hypothetical protein